MFDYEKIKDPRYFREGRLDAHSDHKYYHSKEEAISGSSGFVHSLSGLWKFHYAKNYRLTIRGFEGMDIDVHSWDEIRVPSHIQLEGYDAPHYSNVEYPWEGHEAVSPGQIPSDFNPVASYVKYFEVPGEMQNKRLFIAFEGAESAIAVWLNGDYIGYSGDSFTPSEFELTDHIKEGENKLAVQVFKWSSGSWCEDQDFFRFSGIYRDVYLFTVPEVHIRDLKIRAIPTRDLTKGELELDIKAWGKGRAKAKLSGFDISIEKEFGLDEHKISMEIERPMLWSAEVPNLYELEITVFDESGAQTEYIPMKVGFRRFEIQDGIMLLNGKRIVFKGVNRHDFSAVSGRSISAEEILQDIVTMKQNNINAIRTSHYPNSSLLYSLCDQYGLYMIDEANLETHGSWAHVYGVKEDSSDILPNDRPEWLDLVLDRAESMYERDANHPSILIWSCGNESWGGKDIYEMSRFFHRVDPTRPVHYQGIAHDRRFNATSDMESEMYRPVSEIKEFLRTNRTKPYILCEYAHAMGNSCGAMYKYMELADEEPLFQGGFVWDYIDQTLYKKDRYGKYFQAYGGDFDDRPTDYEFSANGIVYAKDRSPSPKMQEVKFCYQSIEAKVEAQSVRVINKNLFINTNTFDCIAILARDGKQIAFCPLETDVEPLSEKTYRLPLCIGEIPGEYTITVSWRLKEDTLWAKRGHEIAFGQYVCRVGHKENPCTKTKKPQVTDGPRVIGVRGEHFEAMFSVSYGGLVSYRYGGKELMQSIPMPNFWRAPVNNDYGNGMPQRYAQWKIASLYATHKDYSEGTYGRVIRPEIVQDADSVLLTFKYFLPTQPQSRCSLSYRVFGDGMIKMTLSYDPVQELKDMPEFGVMFKMDADYDHLRWYGLGPEETYADRLRGAKLGIYHNLVMDNLASYVTPQECGARMGVRYFMVTDMKGRGLRFEMDEKSGPMMFSALPFTPHELENARHPYELPPVHHTVIRVALAQMGVGGDNSWGAPVHPEFLLDTSQKMEFSFYFRGI